MSKLNVGVGDEFPVNDASGAETHPCKQMRAAWHARREARRERWRQWFASWREEMRNDRAPGRTPVRSGDASYTDVPPPSDEKV